MNVRSIITALTVTLSGALSCTSASATAPEDEIKLAFTYNIARFVTWPGDTHDADATFRLCIVGRDLQRIARDNLNDRRIGQRRIKVVPLERTDAAANVCELVYIAADLAPELAELVGDVSALPVLTVSDAEGFAEAGGIVELRRIADRIALRINVDAGRRAGLAISSQLLALASVVSDTDEAGE